jgi:hypothetical protein
MASGIQRHLQVTLTDLRLTVSVDGEVHYEGLLPFSNTGCGKVGLGVPDGNTPAAAGRSLFDNVSIIAEPTVCTDCIDNDGDGHIDFSGYGPLGVPADPGCASPLDPSERDPTVECDDGVDNDLDGRIDFDPLTFVFPGDHTYDAWGSGDPGCRDPLWETESPKCQNGRDDTDDADSLVDYDGGRSIHGAPQTARDPECIGRPWKDRECGLGVELALVLPALMWMRRRRSRTV